MPDHLIDPGLVAEGRALIAREEGTNWDWGDLMLRVMPPGSADRATVVAFAEECGYLDTGRSVPTLLTLRGFAEAWPPAKRCAGASFTAHAELAAHPERFSLIRPGLSKREARVLAGKKPEIGSKEQRGEVVAGLLADPEVLEQIAANPEFARAVRRASVEIADRQEDRIAEGDRARNPETAALDEAQEAMRRMRRLRREMASVLEDVLEADLDREAGLAYARQLRDSADMLVAFYEGGSGDADLALAGWLEDSE